MRLFDTHAHLDQEEFDQDRPAMIARAREAGVTHVTTVGVGAESSRAAVALAAQFEGVFAAVGIQPNYCAQAKPGDWDEVVRLVDRDKVVAVGETGLDRYWDHTPFEVQQDYFDRHLRLAHASQKPFIVHTRDCDADVLAMLRDAYREFGPLQGIMHSFCGTAETAAECLAMGLHISFAGMVTFKKSQALRDVACAIPADRLLIETDSPYLSPHPLRGKRNEPAQVLHTAQCLADARGESLSTLAEQTFLNAARLFGVAVE